MKKLILILFVLGSFLYAQEETLLGDGEIVHGGFGGPVVKFTSINGQMAVLVGGRGGWIINHSLVIGGGGYGLANEVKGNENYFNSKYLLNFGYGGFELEYIIEPNKAVHGSIYLLLGGGAINQRNPIDNNWNDLSWDEKSDVFFVAEPAANVELNIIRFMRIDLGVGYRFISGVDKYNVTDANLSGVSAVLTFKFGKF
jgi:hypothetical protein